MNTQQLLCVIPYHTNDVDYAKFPPNTDHPKFHCWLKQEDFETTKP